MNLNSQEFISKLINRDHSSIKLIVERYHDPLYKMAIKQNLAPDQAEEVVQETWVTFMDKVQSFEGRSHIRTFIFGILINKIRELRRSNKKYTQDGEDDSHLESIFSENGNYFNTPLNPEKWSESKQFVQFIQETLEELPFNQSMAFQLKEIQGEETEDICKILEVSNTNLGVLLYRAKRNLRALVEKKFRDEGKNV